MEIKLNGDNLRIALQKEGRLADPSRQILKAAGLEFDYHPGRLFTPCQNYPLDLLFLRDDDIPEYVQDRVADLGIAGMNVIYEKEARIAQLDCLGFGRCNLSLAVPRSSDLHSVFELGGKRIATSHSRILSRYLQEKGVEARVIEISGSVEITPSLNVADAVCDLVSTGSTLRMHDLRPIEIVLHSEAVLIANPQSLRDAQRNLIIERLRARLQSHLKARRTKYVMMNAPRSALAEIRGILPGMKSPTILSLADADMIAVHSAVPEELFWEVIEKLKTAGATDILVVPVEKMVV